jgi:hypothetical protein
VTFADREPDLAEMPRPVFGASNFSGWDFFNFSESAHA